MSGSSLLAGLLALATFGTSAAATENAYYINENSVAMTEVQYQQLESMGFSEEEIAEMSEEKFNKLASYKLISTNVETVEVPYSELISDDYKEPLPTNSPMRIRDDFYQDNMWNHGNGGGDPTFEMYTASDSEKVMTTTTSYVAADDGYYVYVKQYVKWNSIPDVRYNDIIAVAYDDDLSIVMNGNYPDIEVNCSYRKKYICKSGPLWDIETKEGDDIIELNYTGEDNVFEYSLDDYIAFKFDLPDDLDDIGNTDWYIYSNHEDYSEFKISLETTFQTVIPNQVSANLITYYVHQINDVTYTTSSLSFNLTPPYITYNLGIEEAKPAFDIPLFSVAGIEF